MLQGGSLWAGIISGGISQLQDTRNLTAGQMDKKEFAVKTTGNVTGAFGVMAGIEYGAMLGTTVLPGVGTVIGSIVGGLVGNNLGHSLGTQAGNAIVNNRLLNKATKSVIPSSEDGSAFQV
jgi:outer membrane lipoprotein SlyB